MASSRVKRLFGCIEAADVDGVRAALAQGASAESRLGHRVPLHETVTLGSKPGSKSRNDHFAIAELLVAAGADVNGATIPPKLSCLQLAIHDMAWVEWLLLRGTNPDLFDGCEQDHDCLPPLMLAVRDGLVPQIRRLIAAGAKTELRCSTTQGDHNLVGAAVTFQNAEVVGALLDAARFSSGDLNEALRDAIIYGRHDAIPVLCAAGARGDHQNRDGQNTIWLAYIHRDRKAIELLRSHTAPELMVAFDGWLRRGVLGIAAYTAEELAAVRPHTPLTSGVVVRSVVEGSAAAEIKLLPWDVITKIDDHPVESFKELSRLMMTDYKGGDRVRVTYLRDGVVEEATATLRAAAFGE